jgi:hypothetical protein
MVWMLCDSHFVAGTSRVFVRPEAGYSRVRMLFLISPKQIYYIIPLKPSGTTGFNTKKFYVVPTLRFVRISEQTATFAL